MQLKSKRASSDAVFVQRTVVTALVERTRPTLTLLVAPAGSGKTTLARSMARLWPREAYCDAFGVDSVAEFAARIVHALAAEDPARAARFAKESSDGAGDPERLVQTARAAWCEPTAKASLFVLDHLDGALRVPGVRALLERLLERPHARRAVVLCSRAGNDVRTTRFAPPHETLTLASDEHRFNAEELRQLFPPSVSNSELGAIENLTRGWVIAVLVLRRFVHEGNSLTSRPKMEAALAQLDSYVAHEVLEELAPLQLTALMACAAIPDLRIEEASLALRTRPRVAEAILRAAPFVTIDADGGTYELHPVVRAAIGRCYAARANSMLQQVANAHRTRGEDIRAAQLFGALGEDGSAAQLLDSPGAYVLALPNAEAAHVMTGLGAATLLDHPAVWAATLLVRGCAVSPQQSLEEARNVSSRLPRSVEFHVAAAVAGAYAKAAAGAGLFGEGRLALQRFEDSLAPENTVIGQMVLAFWRTAYRVWEGLDVDSTSVTPKIGSLLAADARYAFWMSDVVGPNCRTLGDQSGELRALARARTAAVRAGLPSILIGALAENAFGAWFWGDDPAFGEALEALECAAPAHSLAAEGARHFLACARGGGRLEPLGFESFGSRAAGYVIAAGGSEGSDAEWYARAAILAADEAGMRFLQVVARVAAGLAGGNVDQDALFREAEALAAETGSRPLIASIAALRRGARDVGMLAGFVRRFRQPRAGAAFHLSIFRAQVTRGNDQVLLQPREAEVLVALALEPSGIERERLADLLWPDQNTTNALNNLKAYVNRIRRKLDDGVVLSTGLGYKLSPAVAVDLDDVESALKHSRLGNVTLTAEQRTVLCAAAEESLAMVEARVTAWEWFAPSLPRLETAIREPSIALARDALARSAYDDVLLHASRAFERDRCDEAACELAIVALRGRGDHLGAARVLHQHELAVRDEHGTKISGRIRKLV